jgi:bacillithiol biosynthesis cysteine-adding enzyme BshC
LSSTNKLVPPSKSLGYSDIYLDFVADREPSAHFYIARDLEDVAERLDRRSYPRKEMADVLARQNRSYKAGEETFRNIDLLTDPAAVCVFSGQQAGLFGGPLYTLIKALGVCKAAKLYSERLNRPVIPMFWIAGDDHDFEEVNHTRLLNRSGELQTVIYDAPPPLEVPTSEIAFADEEKLAAAKNELQAILGETDFTAELYALIDRAYTPTDNFCCGFGELMAGLTERYGLVFFCPGDSAAKRVAAPLFRQILNQQDELRDLITRTNRDIVQSGYHIQVEKKENACHLFYNLDGRKPVLRVDGHFIVGDQVFHLEDLEARIEEHPQRFSPDVMTRPILQSFLFPTVSQKGGPAEIAYLAQINPIFKLFDIPAPVHRARPTVTIVEKRFEQLMQEYEIEFEDLTGDIEQVVNTVLARSFPPDIEERFRDLRTDVTHRFREFTDKSLEHYPNLQQFSVQSFGRIDYTLKQFEEKVFAQHKKKSKQTRDRIYRLWHALCPQRGLQERSLNAAYFISRYGPDFVDFLYDQLDSEETSHQLVYLSRMVS